ncbi:MAG: RDD family protein [Bdellovibrionota bacterium]|nr:RDD family protein [Bdellovibrionota bacterium]
MSEIEFRPITKGLGFHKNKLQIDESALKSIEWENDIELPEIDFSDASDAKEELSLSSQKVLSDKSLQQNVVSYRKPSLDLLADEFDVDKVRLELQKKAQLSKTLPRDDVQKKTSPIVERPLEDPVASVGIKQNLDEIRKIEERVSTEKANLNATAEEKEPKKHCGNLFAGAIDFVVIFGVVNLFLSSLLLVTKLDVFQIVRSNYQDPMTQLSLGLIFLSSCFLYIVISRSFFGMTLGDWALDIQLGSPDQQRSTWYPVKVAMRFLVNLVFGFVLLPFLSVIFRKDLLGSISGLSLYEFDE